MHRWGCPRCEYVIWAPSQRVVATELAGHILKHQPDSVSETIFRTVWECPKCDAEGSHNERRVAISQLKKHLYEHVRPEIIHGADITLEVGSSGSLLLLAKPDGKLSNYMRDHLVSQSDSLVLITSNPHRKLRLIERQFDTFPEKTVVISPAGSKTKDKSAYDLGRSSVDFHPLPTESTVSDLGTTIVNALELYLADDHEPVVEFSMLDTVIEACSTDSTFKFLHVLHGITDSWDAIVYSPLCRDDYPDVTVNIFEKVFDLVLCGQENRFVTWTPSGSSNQSDPSYSADATSEATSD